MSYVVKHYISNLNNFVLEIAELFQRRDYNVPFLNIGTCIRDVLTIKQF